MLSQDRQGAAIQTTEVQIPYVGILLDGILDLPEAPCGMVIFAHGTGSSRDSPPNRQLASALNREKIATLILDLLTIEEASNRDKVYDIPLLGKRLVKVARWAQDQDFSRKLPLGFLGASTGTAAALWAAANLTSTVAVLASRSGRPDLAMDYLGHVAAPTLLLEGALDIGGIAWNRKALKKLPKGKLILIPGATHLFDEEDVLRLVSDYVVRWFRRYFEQSNKHSAKMTSNVNAIGKFFNLKKRQQIIPHQPATTS